jgi:hypothetical protein
VLLGAEGIAGVPLPVFVEGLEDQRRDVVRRSPGGQLVVVAALLGLARAVAELARQRRPARLADHDPRARRDVAHALEVGHRVGDGLVDVLALPRRVAVDHEEVEHRGQARPVVAEDGVVVRRRHRLRDGALDPARVVEQRVDVDQVVVPGDQRLVADVHRDDDLQVALGQRDGAVHLGRVVDLVGGELGGRDGLGEPGAARLVADLGLEPRAEHDLQRHPTLGDHVEHRRRQRARVVEAGQPEVAVPRQDPASGSRSSTICSRLGATSPCPRSGCCPLR